MDRATLFDCLVAWVNTFKIGLDKPCKKASDFKDGIVIAKCLNNIDPQYFSDDWVTKIKLDTNENWRLKLLNLNKIFQTLTDYYTEVLEHSLSDFEMPNLNLIAESSTTTDNSPEEVNDELSHLLQLVLGCAVNCERKSEFIENIMEMNETTQHMIMTAIQELMSRDRNMNVIKSSALNLSGSSTNGNGGIFLFNNNNNNSSSNMNLSSNESVAFQLKKTITDMNRLNDQKEEVDQKCIILNKKLNELQDERSSLINEIEILKNKLQQEDNARIDPNNDMNKQLRLQQKLDSMQEELYKLELEKEKFRVQFAAAKAEQDILIEKNIELKRMAQEHQNLKDEIDILKHTSDKVEKLESSIENYKIKLEEMADLKKQMKSQEDNNAANLEKLFVMEGEVKKIASLKSQIDMYKKQIGELHEKILGDETKMKKMEYEYKDVEEACSNLKQEKEKVQSEYERLKDSHDKLEFNEAINSENNAKRHSQPDENSSFMDGIFSNVELVNISNETKEKIIRIYHENKFLKLKQNELTDERLILLQTQFDDEQIRTKDLQQKLAEVTNQKIEIECKFNSNTNSSSTASDQELKTTINRLQSQLDEESKKNKKFEQNIEHLNSEKNKIVESKEKDIQDLNDKYRSYLEKAKIVIKSLDPLKNSQNLSDDQLLVLKNQIAEKDKHIKQLNKDIERLKSSRMQEEELIASAWYTLGSQLNRRATDERIATIGNSFLSQQRHLQPGANVASNQTSSSSSSSLILNSSNRMRANGSYKSMLNSSVTSVNAQANQTASATS